MGKSRTSMCWAVLVVASSAFAADVNVSHVDNVDFSKYRTYTVKPRMAASNAEFQARIETDIDAVLQAAGWKKVENGADIEVVTVAYRDDQVDAGVDNLWGAAEGWAPPVVDVRDISEEMLTIDLVDTKTGVHIWRAAAHKTISNDQDTEKAFKVIDKTMKQVFKGFPPK